MKKNDNILILGILFIALVVLGIQLLHSANGTEKVKITVDGKVFGTYLLSEDRTVSVNETNIVLITEGTVSMESADCPDQICAAHPKISKNRESIICLPNKVILEIVDRADEGSKENDAVAG